MDKTINASIRQINNINYIIENGEFEVPPRLQEAANLRLSNREANLTNWVNYLHHLLVNQVLIIDFKDRNFARIKRKKGDL